MSSEVFVTPPSFTTTPKVAFPDPADMPVAMRDRIGLTTDANFNACKVWMDAIRDQVKSTRVTSGIFTVASGFTAPLVQECWIRGKVVNVLLYNIKCTVGDSIYSDVVARVNPAKLIGTFATGYRPPQTQYCVLRIYTDYLTGNCYINTSGQLYLRGLAIANWILSPTFYCDLMTTWILP